MNYFAILRPRSAIFRQWRMKHQLGGIIDHVQFQWHGNQYASGELTADEVALLSARGSQDIQIEAMGVVPFASTSEVDDALDKQEDDDTPKRPRQRQRL
jgi:hypothetical protein